MGRRSARDDTAYNSAPAMRTPAEMPGRMTSIIASPMKAFKRMTDIGTAMAANDKSPI